MIAAEHVLQDRRTASSLRAPRLVERHVMPTLQPLLEIPICEAVTNVVDDGSRHEFIRLSDWTGISALTRPGSRGAARRYLARTPGCGHSLSTAISGASGCFIPTT